jgi:hypothetical protein
MEGMRRRIEDGGRLTWSMSGNMTVPDTSQSGKKFWNGVGCNTPQK